MILWGRVWIRQDRGDFLKEDFKKTVDHENHAFDPLFAFVVDVVYSIYE